MPFKDLLVCLDPTDAGERRLRLAAAIARDHGAHLSAAFVRPQLVTGTTPAGLAVPTGASWMPPVGEAAGLSPPPSDADAPRQPDIVEVIEERFRAADRPHRGEGDFHLFAAGESAELQALLPATDLVVYGQTAPDCRLPAGFRPEDVIVGGGRPILVVPYAGQFAAIGRRPLVAWDGSREGARALHDALPLIAKAEAVTVIAVRDSEREQEGDVSSLARIVRHLERHGLKARSEATLRGGVPIADVLLSRAADIDADMIVAGAYHHSQFREALLGGVSRELLDHMTVPVLMSH